MTINSKEENSEDYCLDFVQEFGHRSFTESVLIRKKFTHASNETYVERNSIVYSVLFIVIEKRSSLSFLVL